MGIFKEDIIQFGNLIDTEVEVRFKEGDFNKVYEDLTFKFTPDYLSIRGTKKVLLFRRSFELRAKPDERNVFNIRNGATRDLGIILYIIVPAGSEIVSTKDGIEVDGEKLKISVWRVLKRTKVYSDIPDAFKDKLMITRYKLADSSLSAYITVTK